MRYFLFMISAMIQLQRGVFPAVALMPNPRKTETTVWQSDQWYITKMWNIDTNTESRAIWGLSDTGAILEDNPRWRCISVTPYEKPISFHDYIIFELRLIGTDTTSTTAMRSFETESTEVAFLWCRLLHAPCIRQMLLRLTPFLYQRPWVKNIDKKITIFE